MKRSPNFYSNRILDQFSSKETNRVTLRQLTVFGRGMTETKLIKSANYVRNELPVRLAHRIRDFQVRVSYNVILINLLSILIL